MKKLRRKKIATAIPVLVFSLVILTGMLAAARIVQYGKADEKVHCDAAIVLGAATTDGEVSPVYCVGILAHTTLAQAEAL